MKRSLVLVVVSVVFVLLVAPQTQAAPIGSVEFTRCRADSTRRFRALDLGWMRVHFRCASGRFVHFKRLI